MVSQRARRWGVRWAELPAFLVIPAGMEGSIGSPYSPSPLPTSLSEDSLLLELTESTYQAARDWSWGFAHRASTSLQLMEGLKLETLPCNETYPELASHPRILLWSEVWRENEGSFPTFSGFFLYLSPTQIPCIHLLTAMAHVYQALSHKWLIPFRVDPFTVKIN